MAANSARETQETFSSQRLRFWWDFSHLPRRKKKVCFCAVIGQFVVSPSTPILPSPSLSPAMRNVLVSPSVRALAVALKFCRNSLKGIRDSCSEKQQKYDFRTYNSRDALNLGFWWAFHAENPPKTFVNMLNFTAEPPVWEHLFWFLPPLRLCHYNRVPEGVSFSLAHCEFTKLQTQMMPSLKVNSKTCPLLQLILLNEAAVVLVNDIEGLLDFSFRFAREADLCEECLVIERLSSWGRKEACKLRCIWEEPSVLIHWAF